MNHRRRVELFDAIALVPSLFYNWLMPRDDIYHDAVKSALIKDGWTITDDPLTLEFEDLQLFADLGAEKPLAATKGTRYIVVEIKTFGGASPISELQKAMGQYDMYRSLLKQLSPQRELYLAVDIAAYQLLFERVSVQYIVADAQMKVIVFEPESQEILQWIS